jgi:hypothetical protein
MPDGCVFRVAIPLRLCPSLNSAAWRDKEGFWARKKLKDEIHAHIMLRGQWGSAEHQKAARLVDVHTFTNALSMNRKRVGTKSARSRLDSKAFEAKRLKLVATRYSSTEPDPGALVEGLKLVVDALVDMGVVWDDASKWLEQSMPTWRKAPPNQGFVTVEIWAEQPPKV